LWPTAAARVMFAVSSPCSSGESIVITYVGWEGDFDQSVAPAGGDVDARCHAGRAVSGPA
jgi:hypothetical protein